MKPIYLFWIVTIWILSNALFPLFINSLERLYQRQIDNTVAGFLSICRMLLVGGLRLFFYVFFAPATLTIVLGEKMFPKHFTKGIFRDIRYAKLAMLSSNSIHAIWHHIIYGTPKKEISSAQQSPAGDAQERAHEE